VHSPTLNTAGAPARQVASLGLLLLLALLAAYSNHFQNEFHFDDWHTVVNNVYIRDLKNIPKFFADARTFSNLPSNQTYRPLVSVTLALDYRLGGLKPFYFHFSTLLWFIVQLVFMFFLFAGIMDYARPHPGNSYLALFATAWYGLHPVMAETINYVIQRGDLYSTLGVVAGLVLYSRFPGARKWGVYLIPVILGALSKPPALMFAPLLFVYALLFEANGGSGGRNWAAAAKASAPAMGVCVLLGVFQGWMTPKTIVLGGGSLGPYLSTQTVVTFHYFRSLFLPTALTADSDRRLLSSATEPAAILGMLFVAALALLAWRAARRRDTRPVSFGLLWFLLALAPTSLAPLAEVENDHRMFFPFVGLTLAMCWAARLALDSRLARLAATVVGRAALAGGAICFLSTYGYAARQRNEVWRTEESLWRDVTVKSPRNGRGLMNYGLVKMGQGHYRTALENFEKARRYTPNYALLEINLGIAKDALDRSGEAEPHFLRAIQLAPQDAQTHFYYGRWLRSKGRLPESIASLKTAVEMNPVFLEARHLLMQAYLEQPNWTELRRLAEETIRIIPGDGASLNHQARCKVFEEDLTKREREANRAPSPENLLHLSLLYHQAGRFWHSIAAAKRALSLRPHYAEAFNNLAAGYEALSLWDLAIQAAEQALRIKPNFPLARNNLLYAKAQKARSAGRGRTPP